jgi:hypothetical protein
VANKPCGFYKLGFAIVPSVTFPETAGFGTIATVLRPSRHRPIIHMAPKPAAFSNSCSHAANHSLAEHDTDYLVTNDFGDLL